MKKRYTLTDADLHLLAEFSQADETFLAAKKAIQDMEAHDPEYDQKVDLWNKAYQERQNKGAIFADCVASSIATISKRLKGEVANV